MIEAREEAYMIARLAWNARQLVSSHEPETLRIALKYLDEIVVRAASLRDSVEDDLMQLEREERN